MKSTTSRAAPTIRFRRPTAVVAPPEQHADLMLLSAALGRRTRVRRRATRFALVGPAGKKISLPESAVRVLQRGARALSKGDAVTILPVARDLTTQQAADILNVSRQYMVQLLDSGKIPHAKTGRHRRIRIADLLAYKRNRDRRRKAALAEVTRIGQGIGGYYGPSGNS